MLPFLTKISALILATGILLPAQQTVWFTPLPYSTQPTGVFGSTDYLSLFSPTAPWQQAASHVQVFKLYGVSNFADSDLTNIISNLKSRNIALALEWPVLSSSTCGSGIEGFGSSLLPTVQRIQSLGGTLSYLAMEQPFEWGSLYQGPNACNWTAQQVANNALVEVAQAKSVFPNLLVGDITAVPSFPSLGTSWPALYGTWLDTWRSLTGAPMAFFHVDIDWSEPNWQAAVAAVRPVVEQRGIPFGMVYNGFLTDDSDAAWMADAENHFVDFEVTRGYAPPEQVDFQSWNPNPTHVLPETDPSAFTYLIDRYFRARTSLTVANNGAQLSGVLSSGANGVAGASVQLTSQPVSGTGTVATYTIAGNIPLGVSSAIVGARINTECYSCNGSADVTVYSFIFNDTQDPQSVLNFTNGLNGWSYGGPAVFDNNGPAPYSKGLHITAQPGQAVTLNSSYITVTPGVYFTFQVTARVSPASVGSGYFTLIWFTAGGSEPSRETIMFEPATQVLTTATTASDGSFAAGIPVDPTLYQVTAQYAGSSTLWPASATVPQNPPASSPPSIVSLTPNAPSGDSVTFSVVFSDPSGWAAIANAEMLINTTLSLQAGCNIGYLPASGGTFQLLNDAGTTWSSTVLSNSQCSLSGATASGVGNNLTLTFTLSFTSSFGSVAQKTIFLQVNDSQGLVAPWAAAGTLSLIPGACTQTGTTTVTDVQSVIEQALGVTAATTDMNGDGILNVVDVQLALDAFGCGATSSTPQTGLSVSTMAHPGARR
jgi:hypothetical protein